MANMSYCRFQNTLSDLKDCLQDLQDKAETGDELSADEIYARDRLIEICREIAENSEGLVESWRDRASIARKDAEEGE
jgi:uridine phosphorylase